MKIEQYNFKIEIQCSFLEQQYEILGHQHTLQQDFIKFCSVVWILLGLWKEVSLNMPADRKSIVFTDNVFLVGPLKQKGLLGWVWHM